MNAELNPILMDGKIVEVNDTAVKVDIIGRLGVITVPRRWVFAEKPMKKGQKVQFYFSYMMIVDE